MNGVAINMLSFFRFPLRRCFLHFVSKVLLADLYLWMKSPSSIPVVFQGRKGAGCNIALHFCDPDGYEFELYCNMDQVGTNNSLRPAEQYCRVQSLEDAVANPLPEKW